MPSGVKTHPILLHTHSDFIYSSPETGIGTGQRILWTLTTIVKSERAHLADLSHINLMLSTPGSNSALLIQSAVKHMKK